MTNNDEARTPAGPGAGGSLTRAEAVAAWREQRRARRRVATQADGVDGFALRRWRRAGVFGAEAALRVQEIVEELLDLETFDGDLSEDALDVLRRCRDGEPVAELSGAVRSVVESAEPAKAVAVLTVVHDAKLPWLAPVGERRLAYLMGEETAILDPEDFPAPSEDAAGAFALLRALRGDDAGHLPSSVCTSVLPWAPLAVLDDLIEADVLTRGAAPWQLRESGQDQRYLMARLAPEELTPEDIQELDWTDARERRQFLEDADAEWTEGGVCHLLQRAAEGDTSMLKELEDALPRPLVLELRRIQDGAVIGNWDSDLLADRSLWRLMSALWTPKAAVNPARSDFHALTALRYAYDAVVIGELKKARLQLDKFGEFKDADPRLQAEVWNMRAYLALLREDLETALFALGRIDHDIPNTRSNRQLVQRRREIPRNDRPHPSNPYLELGLPNGSEVWKHRYRDLRRAYADDRDEAARLNRAMRRIQQAEHAEDWSAFFVLPLDEDAFTLPSAPPAVLIPPLEALPRRTESQSSAALSAVRDRAVAGLLPTLLNAPRRPDHQHRTTA
ncbi:hypothetical protein [Streptomyces sp. NBC_00649]|uniref:hypothetical protein n=1 Tax=Streptomyces sp. NBC_00649 TaxID=2975798 RepID=UPI0032556DE8